MLPDGRLSDCYALWSGTHLPLWVRQHTNSQHCGRCLLRFCGQQQQHNRRCLVQVHCTNRSSICKNSTLAYIGACVYANGRGNIAAVAAAWGLQFQKRVIKLLTIILYNVNQKCWIYRFFFFFFSLKKNKKFTDFSLQWSFVSFNLDWFSDHFSKVK